MASHARLFFLLTAVVYLSVVKEANAQADYKKCAGYFFVGLQCVTPQFRDAYRSAFMSMARMNASQEGKPEPLTEDEAVQGLADTLREWQKLVGPRCESASSIRDLYQDECRQMLRQ